jgi:hypothetical protein
MAYGRRRKPFPTRLVMIGVGAAAVLAVGAVFWFAHQAEANPPVEQEMRVEARNVGPN